MIAKILKKYKIVLALVIFDFLTKVFFYLLLNNREHIEIIRDHVKLGILINSTGLSPVHERFYLNDAFVIMISLIYLIIAIYIIISAGLKINKIFKILIGVCILIALSYTAEYLSDKIHAEVDRYVFVVLRGVGPVALSLVLVYLFKDRYLAAAFSFLAGGNAGNFLSSFYPPFGVIDFFAYSFKHDYNYMYINSADIFLSMFSILIVSYPAFFLFRILIRRKKFSETADWEK